LYLHNHYLVRSTLLPRSELLLRFTTCVYSAITRVKCYVAGNGTDISRRLTPNIISSRHFM